MKKLALIVLLVVGFSTYAQEGKQNRKKKESDNQQTRLFDSTDGKNIDR